MNPADDEYEDLFNENTGKIVPIYEPYQQKVIFTLKDNGEGDYDTEEEEEIKKE